MTGNTCRDNHHFGIAVRDPGSRPEVIRNECTGNMLSGMLLFHHAEALLIENVCQRNQHWGLLLTPDARPNPLLEELSSANRLSGNPRGAYALSAQPLADIGR